MRIRFFAVLILAVAAASAQTPAPRMGKYNCYAYGAPPNPPILIGSFELQPGGAYTTLGKTGRYSFDANASTISWQSGPNKDNQYGGKFEIDKATHKIRITPRGVCMNTAK